MLNRIRRVYQLFRAVLDFYLRNGVLATFNKILLVGFKRTDSRQRRIIQEIKGLDFKFNDVFVAQENFTSRCQGLTWLPGGRVAKKKNLVFLQAGAGLVRPERFLENVENRSWDLIVNHYDEKYLSFFRDSAANITYPSYPGATKFLGYYLLIQKYPEILDEYNYVCFMDDDVEITLADLENLFKRGQELGLDLFQASLSEDSLAEWPILKQKENKSDHDFGYFTAVEVMAPVVSRRLLKRAVPFFKYSVSSWGIDFALGAIVVRDFMTYPAVIYSSLMYHHKKSDQSGGAFYRMLQEHSISPRKEFLGLRILAEASFETIEKLSPLQIRADFNSNLLRERV